MLDSGEVLRALTGEIYRYRLAVNDQMARIALATQQDREERDRIEADEYDLLFAPSMSDEAMREGVPASASR